MNSRNWPGRRLIGYLTAPLILGWLALAEGAFAHKVSVFAWVEGQEVAGEAYFAGGGKAQNCRIEIFDSAGQKLLETQTNEAGEFRFPIPKADNLKIVAHGGEGHQAEYTLPAGELGQSAPPVEPPGAQAKPETPAPSPAGREAAPLASPSTLDRSELEAAIERALDKKLAPIHRKLAEMSQDRIGVQDIVTGVGFILGLFGAAALARRNPKREARAPAARAKG